MPFAATQMKLEIIILNELSQTEGQIPCDITYMWNLKQGTNKPIYKRETDFTDTEQTCGCQREGVNWESGVGRCKLLHLEWINKILGYSTGNYIQYPVKKP